MARHSRIHDVQFFLVGRKANAVRLIHVAGNDGRLARLRVEAVNVGGQLERGFMAFIVRHDAVARIRKPNRPIGMRRQVVRCVELLVLKAVQQYGNRAVVLSSRNPACIVLAGDQTALPIPSIAVAVVRGISEDADFSGLLEPSQHAIVGNVAPDEIAAVREPHGAFCPTSTGV